MARGSWHVLRNFDCGFTTVVWSLHYARCEIWHRVTYPVVIVVSWWLIHFVFSWWFLPVSWVVTGCLALPTECLPRWTEWTGKNGLHEKEDEGVWAAEESMDNTGQWWGSRIHPRKRSQRRPEDRQSSSILRRFRRQSTFDCTDGSAHYIRHHTPTGLCKSVRTVCKCIWDKRVDIGITFTARFSAAQVDIRCVSFTVIIKDIHHSELLYWAMWGNYITNKLLMEFKKSPRMWKNVSGVTGFITVTRVPWCFAPEVHNHWTAVSCLEANICFTV